MMWEAFEMKMIQRKIAHIDQEIAETKRQMARFGPNEIDFEIIRLQEDARANYTKVLEAMERECQKLEKNQRKIAHRESE
jgi:hypothetical protein